MLTGWLYSAGTTRGSPSQSQTLATQASRNTKSPQFPTPHSTIHKSSKSMGMYVLDFCICFLIPMHPCPSNFLRWRWISICLICAKLQHQPFFSYQFSPNSIVQLHLEGIACATTSLPLCLCFSYLRELPFHKHLSVECDAPLAGFKLGILW